MPALEPSAPVRDRTQSDDRSNALLNPLRLLLRLNENLDKKSILVVDGGDFVGTAAYTLRSLVNSVLEISL